ncbi:histone acetyltransferase type b catalytic subunit [Anaeramoeba flamelloides]|uniref:histone acetyltransferase n=1 Tax=Anaeramoeba flamelloides TaxID=1746091 RepID=A0ABQ8Y6U5_9EUKA|nr:histone acetyltransferase type b catalytic subunit [Anaeramoeba flamelloides]
MEGLFNVPLKRSKTVGSQPSGLNNPQISQDEIFTELFHQYTTKSKDALQISFITSTKKPQKRYHPFYTHQFFGNMEVILGYTNLQISLTYTPSGRHCLLEQTQEDMIPFKNKDNKWNSSPEQIFQKINKYFVEGSLMKDPDAWTEHLVDEIKTGWKPPGKLINEFKINLGKKKSTTEEKEKEKEKEQEQEKEKEQEKEQEQEQEKTYVVYRGTFEDKEFSNYFHTIEHILIYFINAASFLQLEDKRWVVYLLFEKSEPKTQEESPTYLLAGIMTAYRHFYYPDKFRFRVSQALILPPFQGHGFGRKLLGLMYEEAWADKNVAEITVEAPVENFQKMRISLDLMLCWKNNFLLEKDKEDPNFVNQDQIKMIQKKLKFHKKQINRCIEVAWYHSFQKRKQNKTKEEIKEKKTELEEEEEDDDEEEEEFRNFTLATKKRIIAQLGVYDTDESKMRKDLENKFQLELKSFERISQKAIQGLKKN